MQLGWSVAELDERITAEEYISWKLYFEEEPFGADVDHLQLSVIGAAIANSMGAKLTPEKLQVKFATLNENLLLAKCQLLAASGFGKIDNG